MKPLLLPGSRSQICPVDRKTRGAILIPKTAPRVRRAIRPYALYGLKFQFFGLHRLPDARADGAEAAKVFFTNAVAAAIHDHGRLLRIILRKVADERGAGGRAEFALDLPGEAGDALENDRRGGRGDGQDAVGALN